MREQVGGREVVLNEFRHQGAFEQEVGQSDEFHLRQPFGQTVGDPTRLVHQHVRGVQQRSFQRGRAARHPSPLGLGQNAVCLPKGHPNALLTGQGVIRFASPRGPSYHNLVHGPQALHGAFERSIDEDGKVVLQFLHS